MGQSSTTGQSTDMACAVHPQLQMCEVHISVLYLALNLFLVLRYKMIQAKGLSIREWWILGGCRTALSRGTVFGGFESITLMSADGTEFTGSSFSNPTKISFEDSTKTVVSDNAGMDSVELKIADGARFDEISFAGFTPDGSTTPLSRYSNEDVFLLSFSVCVYYFTPCWLVHLYSADVLE